MNELHSACKVAGIDVKFLGVRGSAATYISAKSGMKFDRRKTKSGKIVSKKSDIDVFFVCDAVPGARFDKKGFIHPDQLDHPALNQWQEKWQGVLGRDISPAAHRPNGKALDSPHLRYDPPANADDGRAIASSSSGLTDEKGTPKEGKE